MQATNARRPAEPTGPAPLETSPAPLELRQEVYSRVRLNLFWRTFFLLALLLVGSVVAWLQTFRRLIKLGQATRGGVNAC